MKLVKPIDLSVSLLAAISCLLMIPEIPVWAVFIGWAWYYALGSNIQVLKQAVPPMLLGSCLATCCFLLIDLLHPPFPALAATMIAVFTTVFVLMLVSKIPLFSASLPSFNAYSCLFVGYSAKTYMIIPALPELLNACLWITGANFLGIFLGWTSLWLKQRLERGKV